MLHKSTFGLVVTLLIGLFLSTRVFMAIGVPYTHDSENHLARFANFKLALKEGQFPPRWAPNLMNRYGYPVLNYNYPLPNILATPWLILGLNYQATYKVVVSGAVMGMLLGTWWWLSLRKSTTGAKSIAMVSLATAPYVLNAIWFRGSIGEILALATMPWLLGGIERVGKHGWRIWWWVLMVGIGTAWLLSHNVSVLLFAPLLLIWAILHWRFDRNKWIGGISAALIGVGLVSWFWLPAMLEKKWVVLDQAGLSNQLAEHAVGGIQLLTSPMQFGFSYSGLIDSISFQLGIVTVFVLAISSVSLWFWKMKTRTAFTTSIGTALAVMGVAIGMQLPGVVAVWSKLPLMQFIQFPWRLTMLVLVMSPTVMAWLWMHSTKSGKTLLLLALSLQVIVALRLKPVDTRNYPDVYYDTFAQSTTTSNENMPKIFTYLNIGDWQPTATIATGSGMIDVKFWSGSRRRYHIQATSPVMVIEPTMMFPGWETIAVSSHWSAPTKIGYVDASLTDGRIGYQLEPGNYEVETQFTQNTQPRFWGNLISLVTGVMTLITIPLWWWKRMK